MCFPKQVSGIALSVSFASTLDRGNTDWIINIVALNVITFMTNVMNATLPMMMGGGSDSEEWENAPFFLSCPTEN